jgi:hypothetical protein
MSDEFVIYNGVRMAADWPEKIRDAQEIRCVSIDGVDFDRVRYGDEEEDWGAKDHPCHDCAVLKGQFHVPGCDGERCPRCKGQMIGCDCPVDSDDEKA